MNFILVFVGGGLGSALRYVLGILIQKTDLILPISTLTSNVLACIIFAGTLYYMQDKNLDSLKLLLLTGFCGGLSTFSTFGYESYLLIQQNQYLWVSLNIILNVGLCLTAFFIINR
jgi:CrcB protein